MVIINLLLLLALHVIAIFGYVLNEEVASFGWVQIAAGACLQRWAGLLRGGQGGIGPGKHSCHRSLSLFWFGGFFVSLFLFLRGVFMVFFFPSKQQTSSLCDKIKLGISFHVRIKALLRWKSGKLFFFSKPTFFSDLSCEDIRSIPLCFPKCIKYGDGICWAHHRNSLEGQI